MIIRLSGQEIGVRSRKERRIGFVCTEPCREIMYLKVLERFEEEVLKREKVPLYVYISLNNKCNSNCIFCDVHQEERKECIIDMSELISEFSELGTEYIHFMGGGEPFVDEKIWDYIRDISDRGMKVAFTTNGLALNKEKIEELSKYNVSHMFFSIDGHTPEIHNALRRVNGIWETATENIKYIKQYMPHTKIIINHVLNNRNIGFIEQMVKMSEQVPYDFLNILLVKGCKELYFTEEQVQSYSENLHRLKRVIKESKIQLLYDDIEFFQEQGDYKNGKYKSDDYKCFFPMHSAYIDCTSGDVFPCDCTVHRDRKKYLCGNLETLSFAQIWTGMKMEEIREEQINCSQICKENCDFANIYFNTMLEEQKKR